VHALKFIKSIIGHTGAGRYPGVAVATKMVAGLRRHDDETTAKSIRDL
jgi:hypothetical protein